jgi:hypothetical protein
MRYGYSRRGGGAKFLFFIVFLVFAVYFVNAPFTFFKVPEFLTKINNWIIFAGGVLLVIAAFQSLRRYY